MFIRESEKDYIRQMINNGISDVNATVAIHVYFERYAKPLDELPEIIYLIAPNLLTPLNVRTSISWMEEQNLVEIRHHQGLGKKVLRVANDFPQKIEKMTNITGIAQELVRAFESSAPKVNITPLGIVGRGEDNYARLLTCCKNARKSIKYPLLTTDPYDSTAEVLTSVATTGVKVQILVASDKIAMKYKQKHGVAEKWRRRFEGVSNVSIKVFDDEKVTELCSSVLVDDRVLHVVFYDPKQTRSLEGYLVEAANRSNEEELNIIKWFQDKFDAAWNSAYANKRDRVISVVCSPISFVTIGFIACLWLYFLYSEDPVLSELILVAVGGLGGYLAQKIYRWAEKYIKGIFIAVKAMN